MNFNFHQLQIVDMSLNSSLMPRKCELILRKAFLEQKMSCSWHTWTWTFRCDWVNLPKRNMRKTKLTLGFREMFYFIWHPVTSFSWKDFLFHRGPKLSCSMTFHKQAARTNLCIKYCVILSTGSWLGCTNNVHGPDKAMFLNGFVAYICPAK